MEWNVTKDQDVHSVTIPDEFVVAVLNLLQKTGVALDQYRDQTLGTEGTKRIAAALGSFCDLRRVEAEDSVKQKLGVRVLPGWAEKMVEAQINQDQLMAICAALNTLCEFALAQNINIEIYGQ